MAKFINVVDKWGYEYIINIEHIVCVTDRESGGEVGKVHSTITLTNGSTVVVSHPVELVMEILSSAQEGL